MHLNWIAGIIKMMIINYLEGLDYVLFIILKPLLFVLFIVALY